MKTNFDGEKPILIAGPTASGKSALAIKLAHKYNGVIINADALQVYKQWKILTARPNSFEISQCPHSLYGHIDIGTPYSSGHWLKDIRKALVKAKEQGLRPIIIGGTGLYFQILTQGIAEIPDISIEIKDQAEQMQTEKGKHVFRKQLEILDSKILNRIDLQNPVRTRRAWEVLIQTGKSLAIWQDETPTPLLAVNNCIPVKLDCDTEWLNKRIEKRFDIMIGLGALEECHEVLLSGLWDENHPSCKAIGAKELVGHIKQKNTLEIAINKSKIQTRQYAKRQRTWFRSKMLQWNSIEIDKI